MTSAEARREGEDPGPPTWPRPGAAWFLVSVLTAAYAVAILDRVSLALLIQPLQAELKLNDTQFGLLQGMAFSIVYSLLGLPFGLLVDRSSRRVLILATGLAVWSLATIACCLSRNFVEFFAFRMLVGLGEAALVPVATSLIADTFPAESRPKAFGVFMTGSSLGSSTALMLGGAFVALARTMIFAAPALFGAMTPWRIVLAMCGAPGLILAVVALVGLREPARRGALPILQAASLRPGLSYLYKSRLAFGALLGGGVLNLVCIYAILGWFPALFIRTHGWSAPYTGMMLGAVGLPINVLAAVTSGFGISLLQRKGLKDAPMLAATVTSFGLLVFGVPACLASSGGLALALYALMNLFVNWNLTALYSGVALITPNGMRGQVTAIQNIASGLFALTAGNFAVGFLSDTLFRRPGGISLSLASVFLGCSVAAAAVLLIGRGAFRRAVDQLEPGVVHDAIPTGAPGRI